ncbi:MULTISPECIES: phosphocholine-specific phospholipase C [Sphingobacterium]|uniref:phosphocholine-specific phospholipase C n=1 Tax=Sphingobacterium TaxID=28453 RepID=UPI001049AA79|nr:MULTISPECIES: phospholipase C, phosphocholine-specific [Sphingobacterium]MCW2263159.1 phospholipase C [Sphingobacterium kitahiroshimense]TCR11857.1 phospholipase C [Sphingobacterium sp. JUb78]
MNSSRRDFIKKSALLSGSAALAGMLPATIQRALAINPEAGSTFYDAEHVVFLMQENRSFDHLYGTLKGIRGFNDPRAISLPNGNSVWAQSTEDGKTYIPFRLNVKDTKAPWMGSTPHGWADQTDARNAGKYDRWLNVKKPYNKDYADVPLTLGYCDRSDFPFYYSLADAFTVCDQHFCSSITGTHPNRWYWMTGTVREKNEPQAKAHLWNISDYNKPTLNWKTFPERLEEKGISWRIYQNELTIGAGLSGEESNWLGNFGTNVMEYFKAYNVRLHPGNVHNLNQRKKVVQQEIDRIGANPSEEADQRRLQAAIKVLGMIDESLEIYTIGNFEKLTSREKSLNNKAFTINSNDPDFHSLTTLMYKDGNEERKLQVPKGDVLHQFRDDVAQNKLPTVSWLMTPANFSDHPGRPWFGSWYVNEVMEILLKNPEVWKKTIFILTYDENDGFFDHVPPYAAPNPYRQDVGKVSANIDAKMEWVLKDQQTNPSAMDDRIRESSIGLGYRVPLVIASPWTRGGFVNSELFDHTSSLRFLENFLARKFGKDIREENITTWRRSICGDLTSIFRPFNKDKTDPVDHIDKQAFIEDVYKSQYKDIPKNYRPLTVEEVVKINRDPKSFSLFPVQEKGIKSSCPIPYELYVDGNFDHENKKYEVTFQAGNQVHQSKSNGAPFLLYAIEPYENELLRTWEYAVTAGDLLKDSWNLSSFKNGNYHFKTYAPNGFYREFRGTSHHPEISVKCGYEFEKGYSNCLTGSVQLNFHNSSAEERKLTIKDASYQQQSKAIILKPNEKKSIVVALSASHGWYDLVIEATGFPNWLERFAGHVETGQVSKTDPLMGGVYSIKNA